MSSGVAKLDSLCSGHDDFQQRNPVTCSDSLFVTGLGVISIGDTWEFHEHGGKNHDSVQSTGSSSIFVNNKAVARIGDSIECGSTVMTGSDTVFFG